MKIITTIRTGTQWERSMATRTILALCSLVSLLMASGAGTHWY